MVLRGGPRGRVGHRRTYVKSVVPDEVERPSSFVWVRWWRRWRLVGVAEGRETPKGRGASGGGRTGGGRGIPKTGRATSGAARTPRRSPRPAGTTGSASYGRGRTASGRAVPEPRTGRGAGRDDATGDGARRAPRKPAAARPPASE